LDFAFSEEQELLRASVRERMEERYPPERVASIADGAGFDRSEWSPIAAAGWTGISVPDEDGGAGLGFLEELIVAEELGRGLYPGPYFSSVIMALPILRAAQSSDLVGGLVSGERIATVAWAGIEGRFDADPAPKVEWEGGRLTGTRLFVPDLGVSDLLVIVGATGNETAFWVVDREAQGVAWRELPTVDSTRRMGEVELRGAAADRLQIEDPGLLARTRDRALAALATEAVGVGSRALELAVEHAKTRQQFGRAIGTYQAVAHELARAFVELETARSLAYWAGWAVAESDPEAASAAPAAKARAADAAIGACERAIQAHGGIGFTWEHPLHRFYKRALAIGAIMGTGRELRARVAAALLDR
jgi:alkylation response protein AidB-like acyl-CoA dehydrogenase